MTKRKKSIDYRAAKKVLNQYFNFSFKTPRKGKDFTPQQKAAITRKLEKLSGLIDKNGNLEKGLSFIKYPEHSKLPGVDAIRTNKGLFYKLPGAKAVRDKKGKYKIVVKVGQRKDIFFPFPPSVAGSIERIKDYVEQLKKKHNPEVIRWSTTGRRESNLYAPQLFDGYLTTDYISGDERENLLDNIDALEAFIDSPEFAELEQREQFAEYRKLSMWRKMVDQPTFYNGVFFTWFKE